MIEALGPFGWQGVSYLALFCIALVVAMIRGINDRAYAWLCLPMGLNWLWTRLVDCSDAGCGALGAMLIANVSSMQEAVARIALAMQAGDIVAIILLLWLARPLTFRWLIATLFVCMSPLYLLAMAGVISGGAAILWINGLGIAQLLLVLGASSGGLAALDRRSRAFVPVARCLADLDRLASWLDAQTDLARVQARFRRSH